MNLLNIALIVLVIAMLMSLSSKEAFFDFKTMISEGLLTNQKVEKKLSQLKEKFCQNVNNLNIQSNMVANERAHCRYLSRCQDITKINYESYKNPEK
jgi:hypothetical protein